MTRSTHELIAELTAADLTESEATAVLSWVNDWVDDCYGPSAADSYTTNQILCTADRQIIGGLAFVLADVRRCASEVVARDAHGASRRIVAGVDHPRAGWTYRSGELRATPNSLGRLVETVDEFGTVHDSLGNIVGIDIPAAADKTRDSAVTWTSSGDFEKDCRQVSAILSDLPGPQIPRFLARVARIGVETVWRDRGGHTYNGCDILDKITGD